MTARRSLLVVEDDAAHAELVGRAFRRMDEWELLYEESLGGARTRLRAQDVDVVLADLNLPDGEATALCSFAVPVVIMTSQGDEHRAVEAMRGGALDYVTKSSESLQRMPATVQRAIREWQLMEDRRLAELELQRKSEELERNNHRLRAVLARSKGLATVRSPEGALQLVGEVLAEQLDAELVFDRNPSPPAHRGAHLVDPGVLAAATAQGGDGAWSTIQLHRETPFDSSELALAELAANLVIEKLGAMQVESELAASRKRLHQEDKLRSIGQLAGGIAHDFNNMLGAIMGAAGVLQIDLAESSPAVQSSVELILDVSSHAASLTRRLLTFSRGGTVVREPIDVGALLGQLERILEHSLDPTVRLSVRPPADTWARYDPSLVQTALLNLALNARDAMPDGGELAIEANELELTADFVEARLPAVSPGTYVELRVSDTGTGMDEEVLSRVFEPFFTTKDSQSGSGLGLPVVLGTFEDAGGGVLVETEPGVGTTFRCFLPASTPPRASERVSPPSPAHESLRVLVVDDNEAVLRTTNRLLRALGHEVVMHSNPAQALEDAQEHEYDVMLVDIVMPMMDGIEFVRRVFEHGTNARVIYTSGYSENRDGLVQLANDARVSFLPKPFGRAELDRALYATG